MNIPLDHRIRRVIGYLLIGFILLLTILIDSPSMRAKAHTNDRDQPSSTTAAPMIYLPIIGSNLNIIPNPTAPSFTSAETLTPTGTFMPTATRQPTSTPTQKPTQTATQTAIPSPSQVMPTVSPTPSPTTTAIVITATPTEVPTETPPPTSTQIAPSPTPLPPDPSLDEPERIRFAVIGDFGSGTPIEGYVADMIAAQNVDFIATVGDNRYSNHDYDQLVGQYYCDYLADVTVGPFCAGGNSQTNAFFPATGNHDYQEGFGIGEYLDYFNLPGVGIESSTSSGHERYYDVIQGPLHLFFIDSQAAIEDPSEMAIQKNWLQTQLALSTAPWQLVFLHHAPFSASTQHGSADALQWPYADWGADVVLTGHNHTYERIFQDGIVYFVNGLGGKSIHGLSAPVLGTQVQFNGEFGAMIVDANTESLHFRFLDRINNVHDDYTLYAPFATPVVTPPSSGSISVPISRSEGDAEERVADGAINLTSTDLELVNDAEYWGLQTVGLLFEELQIPRNATIVEAYIEFTADEVSDGANALTLYAQAIDNAPPFSSTPFNISSRTTTEASSSWVVPAWVTVEEKHKTPDISALVQAVVSRPGWRSGYGMAFVINGMGHRAATAFDGEGDPPRLRVRYGD